MAMLTWLLLHCQLLYDIPVAGFIWCSWLFSRLLLVYKLECFSLQIRIFILFIFYL
jgi:hypothetical protein